MLNPIVLSIPIFFFLIGIEIIYDRITHKNLYRMNDAVSNISCGIFEQITGVFAKVITVALYDLLYQHYRFFTIPNSWIGLVVLFFGIDLAYYWAHRMSHAINIFWVGHVVHHQSEEYNLSVALRQGAFQKIFTAFFYLPLALVGFNTYWFIFLGAFNTLYQFWIHTEAIHKLGFLERFMNTPSHHRVHHGRNPKYIDRNHAGVFIIWDKMFGTFQKEEEHPVYGITTPTQCWDPVTAHWRPISNLWADREPKEVFPESYRKFETKLTREMSWYLLIHFILILTGTSFFLFGLSGFSVSQQILFTALITLSVMTTGFLFEGKPWALYAELIRLILVSTVLIYSLQHRTLFPAFAIFFAVLVLASVYCLHRFYSDSSLKSTPIEES